MCDKQRTADGKTEPIDAAYWNTNADAIAAQGQRVLAFAMRSVAGALSQTALGNLTGTNLQAAAATGVVLDTATNNVVTVAGSSTANDFVYKDTSSLTVGTVASVAGITAAAGRVSLDSGDVLNQTAEGVIATPGLRAVATNGVALATGDAALLDNEPTIHLTHGDDAEVLVFDLAS